MTTLGACISPYYGMIWGKKKIGEGIKGQNSA
jgi:hypothetical protein